MSRQAGLAQIGVGGVGAAVVRLVMSNREQWRDAYGVDIGYRALFDTRGSMMNSGGLDEAQLGVALKTKAAGASLSEMPEGTDASPSGLLAAFDGQSRMILIDCAVGDRHYDSHVAALDAGWSVVLSNKAPLAVGQNRYDRLIGAARGGRLWNEATVGAGLPVIGTLRSLLAAGDEVEEITGCFSGTLGYITSELMDGTSYSEAVSRAKALGYTEPDPRDDLSGLDVARKALILARTFGRKLNLEDIKVQPLLPDRPVAQRKELTSARPAAQQTAHATSPSVQEFLAALPAADAEFAEKVERARVVGRSLKYVARVPARGEVTVRLEEVPMDTQIGSLQGPDNIVSFRTREYHDRPLTVIGPGAGATVTAMGVVSDVLEAARS